MIEIYKFLLLLSVSSKFGHLFGGSHKEYYVELVRWTVKIW